MTESKSPSNAKVNDFLSLLSLMSQQRFLEDDQRQRELQRNIDELRLRLNSSSPVRRQPQRPSTTTPGALDKLYELRQPSSMKFSRIEGNPNDGLVDSPPAMPKRPTVQDLPPPAMPKRPTTAIEDEGEVPPIMPKRPNEGKPPPMPARKYNASVIPLKVPPKQIDFGINLVKPVVRDSSSIKPSGSYENQKPSTFNLTLKTNTSTTKKSYTSFTDMENNILNPKPHTPPKPAHISQPKEQKDWFSSALKNTRTNTTGQAQTIIKPLHLDAMAATHVQPLQTVHKIQTLPKQKYIPKDTSEIKIVNLSPTRGNMSWLDSAVNKSPEQPKRTFVINKKPPPPRTKTGIDTNDGTSPTIKDKLMNTSTGNISKSSPISKVAPPKPEKLKSEKTEAMKQLERLRKSPVKQVEKRQVISGSTPTDREEFLKQLENIKLNSKTNNSLTTFQKPLAALYQERDTAILRDTLKHQRPVGGTGSSLGLTLSGAPKKPIKPSALYEQKDTELLRSQMNKLGSRKFQTTDQRNEPKPEGLQALTKLKSVKNPPKSPPAKPEALKSYELVLSKRQEKPSSKSVVDEEGSDSDSQSMSSLTETKGSFQDKLSSILRTNSVPVFGATAAPPSKAIERAATVDGSSSRKKDTSGKKLTHPNKGRSKGPKRRLPGSVKSGTNSADSTKSTLSTTKIDTPNTPSQAQSPSNSSPTTSSTTPISDYKKKPPINRAAKKNALENLKPSRKISGEVFI